MENQTNTIKPRHDLVIEFQSGRQIVTTTTSQRSAKELLDSLENKAQEKWNKTHKTSPSNEWVSAWLDGRPWLGICTMDKTENECTELEWEGYSLWQHLRFTKELEQGRVA